MQSVVVLALLVASAQAFLFGPGGLGGLFGAPAGGCDPCAAARAPYYPPQQPAYQPQYQQPAYQPHYQQPAYQPQPSAYQTAPVQQAYQQPAPVQNYQTVSEPVAQTSGGGGAYAQAPPPPPPSSYASGPAAGYKRFH
ncbi:Prion-like-(Q/N-rich)-domain-bearing protein [Caenorhabditis elegans]|uniref:Prion-like-(Q/N-rich)-domain-bearing protein n=1 Tax=Caenorhabditis elegans TaxID=6239 RepID=Q20468_CAEEL|nr:Prion-like-(Q/N-rich)-domain-bearing protein [Caenorhabditis elegans]CAA93772.1 Prion-like-(Q/N-rich)-domain-bearing protein [Caenorhabditis elegans]|eukprot:NP_510532.1 Uncharacterized protein CELE_F46F2.3 [Caenorhabditis elegans]